MAPAAPQPHLALIHGEDDYAVRLRAQSLFNEWSRELGGMDHEIIDAQVGNSAEAFRSMGRLREAVQTLPFFGGGKAIWWQGCSFLGDDRTASSESVVAACAELGAELARFQWGSVRLVISAGKIDKRRSFFKTLGKFGKVEEFASWADDASWADRASQVAEDALGQRGKQIAANALAALVSFVGPQQRQLISEVEKLSLYVGDRTRIELKDVECIVTRNKLARAFALGEAFGDRNLPLLLKCLDEEMWVMQFDSEKSEFGLLGGLIYKVRAMIGISELLKLKLLRPESDFRRYPAQFQRIPPGKLPEDKRFNPACLHPFVAAKTVEHCRNYTSAELIRAMELLLQCNRRLVSSGLEARLVLQQTLVDILGSASFKVRNRGTARA